MFTSQVKIQIIIVAHIITHAKQYNTTQYAHKKYSTYLACPPYNMRSTSDSSSGGKCFWSDCSTLSKEFSMTWFNLSGAKRKSRLQNKMPFEH